ISNIQRHNADITRGTATDAKPLYNDDRSMCIDVEGGNPAAETPVWLWPCWGNAAQGWHYDRKPGLIHNGAFNKCLGPHYGGMIRGDYVITIDCFEGDSEQEWSYDPNTKRFWNRNGRVLDAQWGHRDARTPLWVWDANYTSAQQWNGKIE